MELVLLGRQCRGVDTVCTWTLYGKEHMYIILSRRTLFEKYVISIIVLVFNEAHPECCITYRRYLNGPRVSHTPQGLTYLTSGIRIAKASCIGASEDIRLTTRSCESALPLPVSSHFADQNTIYRR